MINPEPTDDAGKPTMNIDNTRAMPPKKTTNNAPFRIVAYFFTSLRQTNSNTP